MSVIINGTTGISTDGGSDLFGTGTIGGSLTLTSGTANGVTYLNGSKVLTSGSALTFDGTANLTIGNSNAALVSTGNLYLDATGGGDVSLRVAGFSPSIRVLSTSEPVFAVNSAEQMRLTSTGLGIGTSSLDANFKLGVYGSNSAAVFQNTNTGLTASDGFAVGNFGNTTAYVYNYEATPIIFGTSGAEKMRLDSSGNLGLGVTPSAWNSGYKAFVAGGTNGNDQVGGVASGSGITIVSTNYYRSSTPDEVYGGTGFAMKYVQSSGQHQWFTAPSGTAGNAISFTQAMTLDGSGNLLVGSTSNPGTRRLSVNGIISVQDGTNENFFINWNAGQSRTEIVTNGANSTTFWTNSAERMRITSAGNVGIGTSSPTTALQIVGLNQTNGTLDLTPNAAKGSFSSYVHYGTNGDWYIRSANASGNIILQDTGGNVGIGTSSPSAPLTVAGSGATEVRVQTDSSGNARLGLLASAFNFIETDRATGALTFTVQSGASFPERARIDSSGNLLVGGTSAFSPSAGRGNISITGSSSAILSMGTPGDQIGYLFHDGTNMNLFNDKSGYLRFATAGSERMRIESSGNLLVGTTGNIVNNNARVAIVGTEGLRAQATAGGGTACIGAFGTSTGGTYYYVGYDLTAGSIKYQVLFNGNVQNTNNSYGAISDVKLKENIVDATPKLDKLAQVRVVNYNLKTDPDQKLIGVVAQELEQIFPGMVEESPDYDLEGADLGTTTKAVKYSVFVPMLIKAMQEALARIESLEADVATLKGTA